MTGEDEAVSETLAHDVPFSRRQAQFSSLLPQDRDYLAIIFIDCLLANPVAAHDQCFRCELLAGGAVFEAAAGAEAEGLALFSNFYRRIFNFVIH